MLAACVLRIAPARLQATSEFYRTALGVLTGWVAAELNNGNPKWQPSVAPFKALVSQRKEPQNIPNP